MMQIDGACLCGDVAWEATVATQLIVVCHCNDCRTVGGSAFQFSARVDRSASAAAGFESATASVFSASAAAATSASDAACSRSKSISPNRSATPAAIAGSDGVPKLWLSGKSDPLRPTSKDKLDGTKKDPKYLSCLNDCVPRCQKDASKDRSDCFDECQDECCFTYQQCTYTITIR